MKLLDKVVDVGVKTAARFAPRSVLTDALSVRHAEREEERRRTIDPKYQKLVQRAAAGETLSAKDLAEAEKILADVGRTPQDLAEDAAKYQEVDRLQAIVAAAGQHRATLRETGQRMSALEAELETTTARIKAELQHVRAQQEAARHALQKVEPAVATLWHYAPEPVRQHYNVLQALCASHAAKAKSLRDELQKLGTQIMRPAPSRDEMKQAAADLAIVEASLARLQRTDRDDPDVVRLRRRSDELGNTLDQPELRTKCEELREQMTQAEQAAESGKRDARDYRATWWAQPNE